MEYSRRLSQSNEIRNICRVKVSVYSCTFNGLSQTERNAKWKWGWFFFFRSLSVLVFMVRTLDLRRQHRYGWLQFIAHDGMAYGRTIKPLTIRVSVCLCVSSPSNRTDVVRPIHVGCLEFRFFFFFFSLFASITKPYRVRAPYTCAKLNIMFFVAFFFFGSTSSNNNSSRGNNDYSWFRCST